MPRFYFHLYDDIVARDEEGIELPHLEAAKDRASFEARTIASEQVVKGKLVLNHRIEVEDGSGSVLETVHFADVIEIIGR